MKIHIIIYLIAESNLSAVVSAFEYILGHTAHNLFGKFCRIKLGIAFQNRLKQYAFRAFGNRFFCGYNFNAVLFEQRFVVSAVISVTGKPVQLPNDNNIEGMFIAVLNHALKFRTVICLCSQSTVYVIAYDVNSRTLGIFHTFAKLPLDGRFGLIIRTVSCINYCFHFCCSPIRRKSVSFNCAFAGEFGSKHISIKSCICLLSFHTFG